MQPLLLIGLMSLALLPLDASAGRQVCGMQVVPDSVRQCPDGTPPMFQADELQPTPITPSTPIAPPKPVRTGVSPADPAYFLGVWRTRIPGAVWTSPSGYPGRSWLHVSTGVSVGDLIIKPNGTYVWHSYGGKAGKWARGDAENPVVLIDTVEHRRWQVGADPKNTGAIFVWDGSGIYYDGRR